MSNLTKSEENYIEHEVQLRLHDHKFQSLENSIKELNHKLDSGIKHLDNKFMLMFSILLGSIWIPAILHYLHIV